jgi:hypothetical protein
MRYFFGAVNLVFFTAASLFWVRSFHTVFARESSVQPPGVVDVTDIVAADGCVMWIERKLTRKDFYYNVCVLRNEFPGQWRHWNALDGEASSEAGRLFDYRGSSLPMIGWTGFRMVNAVNPAPAQRVSLYRPPVFGSYSAIRGVKLPMWPTMAAAAIPIVLHFRASLRRWRRGAGGQCTACGYDMRATPTRCPECGGTMKARKKGCSRKGVISALSRPSLFHHFLAEPALKITEKMASVRSGLSGRNRGLRQSRS